MARGERARRNTGDPQRCGSRYPQRSLGDRPVWESEGPIVLVKPGNAGGGKGPWFWVLWKQKRMGDWP